MLQIISGKFFSGKGTVNAEESFAILYSNYSWGIKMELGIAELSPVSFSRGEVIPYVLRYMNRYEQLPGEGLVLASDADVTTQFRLLASFWFQAFFYPDRSYVELLCRRGPRNAQDDLVPRRLVPRFFDTPREGNYQEVAGFAEFMKRVLNLRREKYNLFMNCLQVYFDALEALGANYELAYSMYVYLLEALSKSENTQPPTWDDYDPGIKAALDKEFESIPPERAAAIKDILVTNAHLKLTKTFLDFVQRHVKDEFFTSEAEVVKHAIRKSYLKRALENLYKTRSKYVHSLKEFEANPKRTIHVECTDIVPAQDEPLFTFSGLVRLCRHVLLSYLSCQKEVPQEPDCNWRDEVPGIIMAKKAPQYWVWQHENFTTQQAKIRLGGFIEHLLYHPEAATPDMRRILERIETEIHGAKLADRPALLMLYCLWNAMMVEEYRGKKWAYLESRYGELTKKYGIETAAVSLLTNQATSDDWQLQELIEVVEQYQRSRYKANELSLPPPVEIGLLAEIANRHLVANDLEGFRRWVERAVLDAAGRKALQDSLRNFMENSQLIDIRATIGWPPSSWLQQSAEAPADWVI